MKLTPTQRKALAGLKDESSSAFSLRVSLTTLEALQSKGLVRAIGLGHMAMPRSAAWQITQAGLAALSGGAP